MNLADIEKMTCDFLTASQVAQVTGSDPAFIRLQAHEDPDALGYPVSVQGSRVKIPRKGFLFWANYGRPIVQAGGEEC